MFFKGYNKQSSICQDKNGKWRLDIKYKEERFQLTSDSFEELFNIKKKKKKEWLLNLAKEINLKDSILQLCLKILR